MPRGARGVAPLLAVLISDGNSISGGPVQALAVSNNHWGFVKIIQI